MLYKVISFLSSVFLISLLIFGGIRLALSAAGIRPYIVLSGSMEPEIHTGAVALINTKDCDCAAGDIITFQAGGKCVTHRVVKTENDLIFTKGDANDVSDPVPVRSGDVIGTYVAQIPRLGFLLDGRVKILLTAAAAGAVVTGILRQLAENHADRNPAAADVPRTAGRREGQKA